MFPHILWVCMFVYIGLIDISLLKWHECICIYTITVLYNHKYNSFTKIIILYTENYIYIYTQLFTYTQTHTPKLIMHVYLTGIKYMYNNQHENQ